MNRLFARLAEAAEERKDPLGDSPAVPLTDDPEKAVADKPRPARERRFQYMRVRAGGPELEGMIEETAQREKWRPGTVSRELVEQLIQQEADFRKAVEDAT